MKVGDPEWFRELARQWREMAGGSVKDREQRLTIAEGLEAIAAQLEKLQAKT